MSTTNFQQPAAMEPKSLFVLEQGGTYRSHDGKETTHDLEVIVGVNNNHLHSKERICR